MPDVESGPLNRISYQRNLCCVCKHKIRDHARRAKVGARLFENLDVHVLDAVTDADHPEHNAERATIQKDLLTKVQLQAQANVSFNRLLNALRKIDHASNV